MLGHNTNLNKPQKAEMIPCILYDHCAIKLKTDTKQSSSKYINSEFKQLVTEWWIGQEINQGRNDKIPWMK